MRAGFWLRVNDVWFPLDGVQANVPVAPIRNRSNLQTVGGFNYEYASRRASREWTLDFVNATPQAVRLALLAANGQAGDVWLLSEADARANMLDPLHTVGPDTSSTIVCDGLPLRALVPGTEFGALVRAGVTYTLSAYTDAAAGTTVATYDYGTGAVPLKAGVGTGDRRTVAEFTPAADAVLVGTTVTDVAGVRLAEGVDDGLFLPGRKAPCRAAVMDPDQTLNMLLDDEQGRSAYTIKIRETA